MGSCLSKPKRNSKSLSSSPPVQSPGTMSSQLHQLLELMTTSVAALDRACKDKGSAVPDLYTPFHPSSEAFRADPAAAEAASIISAAALHIAAILTPPHVSLYHIVGGHFKAAALRVCLESNVTEILREAGPEGLHIDGIAKINGQDPQKLGRFLRILATNHIYRELKPNVFTNTRISSMLDTLKSSKDILADPEHKHDNTPGLAALASHHLDEPFKAAAYAWETLADPATRHSGDPEASPFARAIGRKETLWKFYERPEEHSRHHRFGIGMQGIQALQPPDAILAAFNWSSLPADSVVVDVGGGVGSSAMSLAKNFPGLKVVIQDLPGVVEEGKKIWEKTLPEPLSKGQVTFQAHDFFTPQPQKNAAVYLLKQIMHDWSDEYCIKFLKQLRASASADSKLLLMDSIMPFACHDPQVQDESKGGIPGAVPREAPSPLLANYGAVNEMGYNADIDMFLLFNSQERTITHMDEVLRVAGWKVAVVHRQDGDSTFLQSIEAVPL